MRLGEKLLTWLGPSLSLRCRAEGECGEGPARDRAKALGQRWRTLVNQFTGGDGDVERLLYQAADKYYINCERSGLIAPNVVGYIRKVFEVVDA